MNDMKVFVVNLGEYVEGKETGRWFSVPVNIDEMKKELGLNSNQEEYAIHDYDLPFEIEEYTPIEEVNRLCKLVQEIIDAGIAESNIKALCKALDDGIEELAEKAEDICFYSGASDMRDVACKLVIEEGLLDGVSEKLALYFDYKAYGRDLEIMGNYVKASGGIYGIPR